MPPQQDSARFDLVLVQPLLVRRAAAEAVKGIMITAVFALAAAGCGGAAGRESRSEPARPEPARTLTDAAPAQLTAGWRTDFSKRSVPFAEIQSGGAPKDGIPAIDAPRFLAVDAVDFIAAEEPVIAVGIAGESRAYPIQILIWHEIVNDEIAGVPVAVTFCPLCNTAIVFDRRVGGRTLHFGTTGNLRHSDLVMYDRQTESWWQQFGGEGIVGRYTGVRLKNIPAQIVAWEEFRQSYPTGFVLERPKAHPTSRNSDFLRPYGENPYQGYDDIESSPLFAAANGDDDRLAPKERVVFIERGGDAVAVSFAVLEERRVVRVKVGGHRLLVSWRPGVASALDVGEIRQGRDVGAADVLENGQTVPFSEPFWFAVAAFRPDVRVVG